MAGLPGVEEVEGGLVADLADDDAVGGGAEGGFHQVAEADAVGGAQGEVVAGGGAVGSAGGVGSMGWVGTAGLPWGGGGPGGGGGRGGAGGRRAGLVSSRVARDVGKS